MDTPAVISSRGAARRPDRARGIGQRRGAGRQRGSEQTLGDDLDRHVQQDHQRGGRERGARHVAGRVAHFAAGDQRRLGARIGEHHHHHRDAERVPRRPGRPRDPAVIDDTQADAGQQEQRCELERGQGDDGARAQLHAMGVERDQQQVDRDQECAACAGALQQRPLPRVR
jgi:hypothetical protein